MNANSNVKSRVIGLDSHPDTFTAALLQGRTPAEAVTEKIFNKIPMAQLGRWAQKQTGPQDQFVLEASGNSFQVVRTLALAGRKALVLESCQMGKLKEAHANNDKISAVRIGKAYLAGTAKTVWVPDALTQERRDWFHAHRKAVKRTTQLQNRIQSYLSDNGVRLNSDLALDSAAAEAQIRQARPWSARQWQVLQAHLMELRHAQEQRGHWTRLMAQEVISDPQLLSIVRLCGVRDQIAFALGAIIGDIHRFAEPRKLVKYLGLDPAFDDSGASQWKGGIGGHGRKDLRALMMQGAQSILRSEHPLGRWGRKLLARKGSVNLAVAAIARKLTVAVWYLMMGKWTPLEEIDDRLAIKVGKMITQVGSPGLKALGQTRAALRKQIYESLRRGRFDAPDADPRRNSSPSPEVKVYVLDANKKMAAPRCPRCGGVYAVNGKKKRPQAMKKTSKSRLS
jgi:transposase